VLDALLTHRVAHFACHGHVDWTDPARSSLILTDHATTPLTLADIITLNLDADLAYLSACDTAVTAPRLADESLHITAAFHLAGYRNVIGTLWPINDQAAAQQVENGDQDPFGRSELVFGSSSRCPAAFAAPGVAKVAAQLGQAWCQCAGEGVELLDGHAGQFRIAQRGGVQAARLRGRGGVGWAGSGRARPACGGVQWRAERVVPVAVEAVPAHGQGGDLSVVAGLVPWPDIRRVTGASAATYIIKVLK